jgi:hypothetical protein
MANLVRMVAEVLVRAHMMEQGPTGSDPKLQEPLTGKMIEDLLHEQRILMEHSTIVSILQDLASQDYITLGRGEAGSEEREVVKVYPARLKRDFNLWHVAEEM